jgi:hypothetical protein
MFQAPPWIEHPHSAKECMLATAQGSACASSVRAVIENVPASSAARAAAVVDRRQGMVAATVPGAIAAASARSLTPPRIGTAGLPAEAVACRLIPHPGARSGCGV